MYRKGIHLSIAGGLSKVPKRVHDLHLNALQIFSRNPRSWRSSPLKEEEVRGFREGVKDFSIWPVVVHCNYLVNLSSPDDSIFQRSIEVVQEDLKRCNLLGAHYLVLHPGNHKGQGVEKSLAQIAEALNQLDQYEITLLLENTAGAGTEVGSIFQELGTILHQLEGGAGVCLDTCHAFAAGYDLRTEETLEETLRELEDQIGLERLLLIHANDAKRELASRRDHHQHIGEGFIGEEGFKALLNHRDLLHIPFILETPQKKREDVEKNISRLFSLGPSEGRFYED